jgi:hypothetical protein
MALPRSSLSGNLPGSPAGLFFAPVFPPKYRGAFLYESSPYISPEGEMAALDSCLRGIRVHAHHHAEISCGIKDQLRAHHSGQICGLTLAEKLYCLHSVESSF